MVRRTWCAAAVNAQQEARGEGSRAAALQWNKDVVALQAGLLSFCGTPDVSEAAVENSVFSNCGCCYLLRFLCIHISSDPLHMSTGRRIVHI